MKSILIVCGTFFPKISPRSFRATELAKELVKQGHNVKVITTLSVGFNYNEYSKLTGIQFKDLGDLRFSQLKSSGNPIISIFVRIVNRLMLQLLEYPDIQYFFKVIKALRKENKVDLLISIAVPHPIHWGVAFSIKARNRIAGTWVADCGDPYMGDEIDTFRKFFYFKYVEKWFSRKADYITIPISAGLRGYYPEFHSKIKIIPQGFNFSEFVVPDNHINNNPIEFAYAGGFVPLKRDPRPFLKFLALQDIDFKFHIFTKKIEILAGFQDLLGDKLEIHDYIPREQLIPFLIRMDFLVNFDNNTETHSPSKLIDYALTKRPILNIKSDLNYNVILDFLNRDYSSAHFVENIEQYNISSVAQRFLKLIK